VALADKMVVVAKPLIVIPRWKAPTWERTGYYLDALEDAGARCSLVDEKRLPDDAAGFLLMGGVDVNPRRYGEKPGPHTDKPNDDRDTHELRLLDDALARDIPVLAICRGHQLLNVALGGSLLQHLDDDAHRWLENGDSSWHDISFDGPSRLSAIYDSPPRVNSRHHQGITPDRLASPLRATAFAHEGYIEGAESADHRWVVGVQWHPERPEMREDAKPLFAAFVAVSSGS
jgi:gamma-glutamyl-gamma-aminobutyrate hydrolase PuuD